MYTNLDEMQTFSKASMEATTASFGAYSKGLQAIATELADYSRKVFQDGTNATEQLLTAKTPEKALEVQGAYIKSSYEGLVAQSTKLGDLCASFARDAYKPFETRPNEPRPNEARASEARPAKTSR